MAGQAGCILPLITDTDAAAMSQSPCWLEATLNHGEVPLKDLCRALQPLKTSHEGKGE